MLIGVVSEDAVLLRDAVEALRTLATYNRVLPEDIEAGRAIVVKYDGRAP